MERAVAWAAVAILAIAGTVLLLDKVGEGLAGDPLPSLLRDLTANGGFRASCPPASQWDARVWNGHPSASAPEVDRRFSLGFPPGSPGRTLAATLKDQGFSIEAPCANDTTVQWADYHQKNGFTPATASVAWKFGASGAIVRIRGSIFYGGL